MRRLIALAAITAITLSAGQADDIADRPPVTWLFIQNASAMQFDGETLTLTGLMPTVTAFSDRPDRLAVPIHAQDFVALWAAGADDFAHDPPNAGLSVIVDGKLETAIVELNRPVLQGDTIHYDVTILEGPVPQRGEVASLFVDAFPTTVNGQITDAVTHANTKVLGDAPAMAMGNLYQDQAPSSADAALDSPGADSP